MRFERARQLADAVLLEGYVLYPYRASSAKNRFRWTFGVLAPKAWTEAGGCEAWWMESASLLEPGSRLQLELRFLQVQRRRVLSGDRDVESIEVDGRLLIPFEEGVVHELDFEHEVGDGERAIPFEVEGGEDREEIESVDGRIRARVIRERASISGRVVIRTAPAPAERPLLHVRIRVENTTPDVDLQAHREVVVLRSLVSAHLLIGADDGRFVSLLDPPEWAQAAVSRCKNVRTFPVLVGDPARSDVLLSSPIVLYDHPRIAPESPGDFFDATEVDEMLALRTMTLTDEEKRQARATDRRAAEIVDRIEALPPETMTRLHGALRELRNAEMVPRAPRLRPGLRVRLRPGHRRTDAQDLLYAGMVATIEEVKVDIDGQQILAVTIDDDPAAELHRWYGRFHYYYPDEVEAIEEVRT